MGGLTLLLHTASGSRHYKTIPLALAKSHLKSLLASEGGSDDLDCCCVFCRTIAKQTFEKEESSEGRKKKSPVFLSSFLMVISRGIRILGLTGQYELQLIQDRRF